MVQSFEVAERNRRDIADGVIDFGQRIGIAGLAKRYGVSAMPVREAFRQLGGQGFIVLEPNKSARARDITETCLAQLFEMHLAVEVVLARSAPAVWKPTDTSAADAINDELGAAAAAGDAEGALALIRRVYIYIYERADHAEAFETIDRHCLFMAALWERYGYAEDRLPGVLNDHWHIVRSLDANPILEIGMLTGAHAIKSHQQLLRQVRAATAMPSAKSA